MDKQALLYEGKAKKVFATGNAAQYIVQYKDDATAFNGQKRGQIHGKGSINNRMSNRLFRILESAGVPTHFIEELSETETLVEAVTIIPLEVVVRNLAAGSMAKRLGVEEGTPLQRPIVEFYYKNDALGDPLVTEDHITVLGWATAGDVAVLRQMALTINRVLSEYFRKRGIILVDFKLEFGRTADGKMVLADEISPDTCRFWDAATNEKLDKDRFRRDLGGVEEAYQEMWRRMNEEVRA
ncbi:phosphoribosylaminoimidazole-succinocarboxamide synthase [Alicyclobacillus contaminans]|uniref:phosphoribosylaminoimidazolesuccinocarboxamide synthase n=1 Tax=Alicyclobacillus contaminans TaxID=392016 RepID=UPI0004118174|nr:phosphoribosylaminoimidazolesuccinocarboxamide synthase [Alicyclobacillus contaminans]GMA50315.1 phosphoribosylaminoimidazole-succinocarboxamide synthase [Alicyclobacillus contaminans]